MTIAGIDPKRTVVHFKAESPAGTYTAPVIGTDLAFRCTSLTKPTPYGEPDIQRDDDIDAHPGGGVELEGSFGWQFDFEGYLNNWGATDSATAHELAAFFAGCPLTITPGAADGDDLTIDSKNGWPSATFSVLISELNGNDYKIKDCQGIINEIKADHTGDKLLISGSVKGLWVETPAATAITHNDVAYSSQAPVMNRAVVLSDGITGTRLGLSGWTFNPGMALEESPGAEATMGYETPFARLGPKATFQYNILARDETSHAVIAEWKANAESALLLTCGSAGSEFEISLPTVRQRFPVEAEGNGKKRYDVTCAARWDATTDRSFRLIFS